MHHPVVQYYNSIRTSFPRISFSFAYGSAVFKQLGKPLVSSMHVFLLLRLYDIALYNNVLYVSSQARTCLDAYVSQWIIVTGFAKTRHN